MIKVYCEECSGAGWILKESADPDGEDILEECKACDGCGFNEFELKSIIEQSLESHGKECDGCKTELHQLN